MNLAELRRNYAMASLELADTAPDPITQFVKWFGEALEASVPEPNAMTLATASSAAIPNARVVLLKSVSPEGFVFYTDYRSTKGRELAENPRAALVFFWGDLERQVRIIGTVSRLPREAAQEYFQSRPRGSQVGAWASHQSIILPNREILERRVAELAERYEIGEIPLPPHWGGFVVVPTEVEFWQGRPSRLHDRIAYLFSPEQGWSRVRRSP